MLKKQSKKLAVMLVLSMIASLFVGVGTASAANGVAVSVSRVMSAEGDANEMQIGNLQIKEDTDYVDAFVTGDSFIVSLPSNLKWWNTDDKDNKIVPGYSEVYPAVTEAGYTEYRDLGNGLWIKLSGSYTMTVRIAETDDTDKDVYDIPLIVNFDGVEEGYAYATIDELDSPVPGGDYAIAQVLGGGTSLTCASTFTIGPDAEEDFIVRLTETSTGTFDDMSEVIKLTLPKKVDFKSVKVAALGGFSGDTLTFTDTDVSQDYEIEDNKAWFKLSALQNWDFATTTARGVIEITAVVNIAADANEGEVMLDVEGNKNVDDESVKVGTIAEYGVAVGVDDPTTVLAGRVCEELGTITIYENVADTLNEGRSITVTLPDGVKFAGPYKQGDLDITKGSGKAELADWDESSITIKMSGMSKTSRTKLEIPMETLNIEADFLGDIVVEVSGRAGAEGEVVIGTVVAPVEVSVDTVADVKIGYQGQAIADINITETETGALIEDGYVVIALPAGVQFQDKEVEVEVTEGNLDIADIDVQRKTQGENAYVSFKIDSESTASNVSTVTISGLLLDVDRTVSEGPIGVIVGGSALVPSWNGEGGEYYGINFRTFYNTTEDGYDGSGYDLDNNAVDWEDYLFDEDELGRYTVANCVTPGVQETVTGAEIATSSFVVGSTAAIINGEATTLPVAPVIINQRSLMPVRYLSYACGVQESNVVWNPDEQTVTILGSNGVVIQLTIGSTTMLVNGIPVVMDVAPQIINGYTYLPGRYVANALGYNVGWDAATGTITITPLS